MSKLLILLPLLLAVAFFTLLERRLMAALQRRIGPNVIGIYGLLQPFADALKLLLKEILIPQHSNTFLFILSPLFTFCLSLILWLILPNDFELGILYILAISGLSLYGILIGSWSSNSKYALLGGLRSTAQLISYELSIGMTLFCICIMVGSFNITHIYYAQSQYPLLILLPLYITVIMAETNRTPFDLPESESETVAGYFVEYSAIPFVLYFLAEYTSMLFMSTLTAILFFSNLNYTLLFVILYIWIRASFPRIRYDQVIILGWKILIPISLSFCSLVPAIVIPY